MKQLRRCSRYIGLFALFLPIAACLTLKPSEERLISASPRSTVRSTENAQLVITNSSVAQQGEEVRIGGKVRAIYDVVEREEWTETWEITHYGAYNIPFKRTIVREKKGPEQKTHVEAIPRLLDVYISMPNGPSREVRVARDGSFEATFSDARLRIPEPRAYYDRYYHEYDVNVKVGASDSVILPESHLSYASNARTIGVVEGDYELRLDRDQIRRYVEQNINNRVFGLVLNTKDKISRSSVRGTIRLECVDAPDVDYQLRREFEDAALLSIARGYVANFLAEGEVIEEYAQSVYARVIEGGQYSVEVVNPDYHFFQGFFQAESSSSEKSVLLVDKGTRIRVDLTEEGEGLLIDE